MRTCTCVRSLYVCLPRFAMCYTNQGNHLLIGVCLCVSCKFQMGGISLILLKTVFSEKLTSSHCYLLFAWIACIA